MRSAAQFIIRQSRSLAFVLLMFALLRGLEVCQGLWQGSGLHGYVVHYGKAHSGFTVSVWAAFLQALALAGAAGLFACIASWHRRRAPRAEARG